MIYPLWILSVVFIAQISDHGKFTGLHELISIFWHYRIKSTKNYPRNYAVPELFFKNCSEDEVENMRTALDIF